VARSAGAYRTEAGGNDVIVWKVLTLTQEKIEFGISETLTRE
jgi:hypothetical protein